MSKLIFLETPSTTFLQRGTDSHFRLATSSREECYRAPKEGNRISMFYLDSSCAPDENDLKVSVSYSRVTCCLTVLNTNNDTILLWVGLKQNLAGRLLVSM
jgi:hypothetical protein